MKRTTLIILLLTTWIASNSQNINFGWAIQNGQYGDDRATNVATDVNGNVYYCGSFVDSTDVDPGPSTFMIYAQDSYDGYMCKLDSSGNLIWAKHFPGKYDNWVDDVFVDDLSNVYVAATFSDTADADPGIGIHNLVSAGGYDGAVIKLDSNGDFAWANSFGGLYAEFIQRVVADDSGNVFICGRFQGAVDFGSINIFLASNNANGFLAALDSAGQFVWATHMGSAGNSLDEATDLVQDDSGNIYTTGFFRNTAEFNPSGPSVTITALGAINTFITKHDKDGAFVWARAFNGSGSCSSYGIALGANSSLWIGGSFEQTIDFDPGANITNHSSAGGSDIFFARLSLDGDYLWSGAAGGTSTEICRNVTTDNNGSPYFVGLFSTPTDFNPGAGVQTLTAVAYSDIFVLKLDTAGVFSWVKQIGGTSAEEAWGVAVHANRNFYSCGFFNATLDFDPGVGYYGLTALGTADGFVQKMNDDLMTSIPDNGQSSFVEIYPVPASSQISFNVTLPSNDVASVIIYDIWGRVVQIEQVSSEAETHVIDISQLPSGNYYVRIEQGEEFMSTGRFIKQ
ncbi:MAG: T9SS type A sorting domain-containing protein [Bacteroidia bacterium]|nr:T9SS type A sorting domain-containing protein [Bacteroidia bacterium]